jgi:FKBP-type peptidyl-prolyl cis-trans isomerase FkpA
MNMIRIANVLIALAIVVAGCKGSEKETPNGMKFKVLKTGDGVLPKKGEIVVFEFVTKDSKDSVWNSTYKRGLPGILQIQDSAEMAAEDGMAQMFRMLSKGDSVNVTMPVTKFFKDFVRSPIPPHVDSTLNITYLFKIEDIVAEDNFREYQAQLFEKRAKSQKSIDEKKITEYLKANNITAERDTSGIHYVIHSNNGKQKPTAENCVQVNYEGKFLETGQTFDKNDNISFPLDRVIMGWQLGIPKLGLGDSATLYIPSSLAYGQDGVQGAIPPNSILIFNVELTSIGTGYDQATQSCN